MKKTTLSLFFIAISSFLLAQTIVSTQPQNKKIIFEEFTGVNCGFCPSGHTIANNLKSANPGNFFIITVHAGFTSIPNAGQPNFQTTFGWPFVEQSGGNYFPSGTVNRTNFPTLAEVAGTTILGRFDWATAVNIIKNEPSYVNVAASATIDVQTRLLTVRVETYYTGTSPVATNRLNVALLQDNTLGFQAGGNLGNNYNHRHRLVHLLTGQWGENITTTTSGTLVTRNYTYTIPAAYNNIPALLEDMEIVASIAEGNQKIISGNGCLPTFTGMLANDAKLFSLEPIGDQCATTLSPKIVLQNNGQNLLTNLPITYKINNGSDQVFNWTGNLSSFAKTTVLLPAVAYSALNSNTCVVTLPADSNVSNNSASVSFAKAAQSTTLVTLEISPDNYGSEISWNIKNPAGTTVASGGPYPNNNTTLISQQINLQPNICYTFNMIDSYGDGIGSGSNFVKLTSSNNAVILNSNGLYGTGLARNFSTTAALSQNVYAKSKVTLLPNPSAGLLTLQSFDVVDVQITDVFGKVVFEKLKINNGETIDLTNLQKNVYFAKVSTAEAQVVQKIVLQ